MSRAQKARLSVSTWSLHRTLGRPAIHGPDEKAGPFTAMARGMPLLELPGRLASFGIYTLEICHFHLPTRDPAYLLSLRRALDAAGVELFSLLIDGGDISDPEHCERDLAWTEIWLDVAVALGASHAHVSAGNSHPTTANIARSRAGFERLLAYIGVANLRLMTENWHLLLSNARAVHQLLDPLGGRVGLCADFGNWSVPNKYDELAAILPRAESCHAKCSFTSQTDYDHDDYVRCLELSCSAGFTGPYTLIYDGPDADEWSGLDLERAVVSPYVERSPTLR